MKTIQVYDPPMCCSTGVCGPSVDEKLVRFSADLERLKGKGIVVERYNLSQQPGAFVKNSLVKGTLSSDGNDCLPIILVDGAIVRKGTYPSFQELETLVGISAPPGQALMTEQVRELVAIGAAIACNCETCFKFHYDKAKKLGVSEADMLEAVEMSLKVKTAPAESIQDLAFKYLKKDQQPSRSDNEDSTNEDTTGSGCGSGSCC